jgi:hypothetical protein
MAEERSPEERMWAMRRDADHRIAAWEAKFNTQRVKEILDVRREQMSMRVQASFEALCSMETQVKKVLDMSNVPSILYVPYLDYARELYHRKRKMEASGDSMVREAQVLLEKWQARTLDPVVLARIRTQVFDVAAPAGP